MEPTVGNEMGRAKRILIQQDSLKSFHLREEKKQSQLTVTPVKRCNRDLVKFTKKLIIANSEHWLQTGGRALKLRGDVKTIQPNDSYADNNIAVQKNRHNPAVDTAQIPSPGTPPT